MTDPTADVLDFEITFLSPFRVSTGEAAPGLDATIDRHNALPASSLKGVMRATASKLLGDNAPLIGEVFGSDQHPCRWHWSKAGPLDEWAGPTVAARVTIGDNHTATRDMLALAEETYAPRATFQVTATTRFEPEQLELHRIVLAVAGQATRSLGAARRRGLGWVSVSCSTVALPPSAVQRFLANRLVDQRKP
ncbi:MAG: RAMP superfamily CRISPR-associated protein [Pseudonocardiaceae bacterium]